MGWTYLSISKGNQTKVDDDDYERLRDENILRWNSQLVGKRTYVSKNLYRDGACLKIYLHRWIMKAPAGMTVDHINGDALDNRKENLRLCLPRDNSRNKAYYDECGKVRLHGIQKVGPNKWRATITINRKSNANLGVFSSEKDAAQAYDLAAVLFHGEFAVPNYPAAKRFLKLREKLVAELSSHNSP